MKAIICKKYGPAENLVIVEREKPIPKADEVLIKIHAASVTDSDIFIRSSRVPLKMLIPFRLMIGITRPRNEILGEVLSGVVESAGKMVKRFKPGDEVYGITGMSLGAYADYKCMKVTDSRHGCLAIKPKNINHEDATAAAYGGLLALQFLELGKIRKNQKILIYGASGTTGTIAIQYAKSLGAEVTAVCSSGNFDLVQSLGADKTLNYMSDDSVLKLETYDLIMDAVGKRKTSPLKEKSIGALSPDGKYVSIDDCALNCSSARLEEMTRLVEEGIISPINGMIYRFEQIIEAHKYVETGHKKGGVAITVNS